MFILKCNYRDVFLLSLVHSVLNPLLYLYNQIDGYRVSSIVIANVTGINKLRNGVRLKSVTDTKGDTLLYNMLGQWS